MSALHNVAATPLLRSPHYTTHLQPVTGPSSHSGASAAPVMAAQSVLGSALLGTADSTAQLPDPWRAALLSDHLNGRDRVAVAQTCKAGLQLLVEVRTSSVRVFISSGTRHVVSNRLAYHVCFRPRIGPDVI